MTRCCFDCDYFQIEGKAPNEMAEADWDNGCAEGECHLNPPVVGPEIERNGDTFRCFGKFPKVLVTDWCGQFMPRASHDANTSPTLARVALLRGGWPTTRIAPRRDTWPP